MEKAVVDAVPLRILLEMCSELFDFSFKKKVRLTFKPYYRDKRLRIRTAYPYKKSVKYLFAVPKIYFVVRFEHD